MCPLSMDDRETFAECHLDPWDRMQLFWKSIPDSNPVPTKKRNLVTTFLVHRVSFHRDGERLCL